jgi:hypothetical protein
MNREAGLEEMALPARSTRIIILPLTLEYLARLHQAQSRNRVVIKLKAWTGSVCLPNATSALVRTRAIPRRSATTMCIFASRWREQDDVDRAHTGLHGNLNSDRERKSLFDRPGLFRTTIRIATPRRIDPAESQGGMPRAGVRRWANSVRQ